MRSFVAALVVALAALVVPATASAATDSVSGVELAFTSTQGTFAGKATGEAPGFWKAVVDHTPLSPNATITSGSFTLVTTNLQKVVGSFAPGGTVTQVAAGASCTNQQYVVTDNLVNVGLGGAGSGTGSFQVLLTHLRVPVPFLGCVTYSATVNGTLSLSF